MYYREKYLKRIAPFTIPVYNNPDMTGVKIDQLIRSKRRSIALIIKSDGSLVVRAPLRAPLAAIQQVIDEKSAWIHAKREEAKATAAKSAPRTYTVGEEFLFLGKAYPLQIVQGARKTLELGEAFRLDRSAVSRAPEIFSRWYKQQAFRVISERLAWYTAKYGYTFNKLRITSAQTRWGSCSSKGTISFTWRLVMAPLPVIDSVVVHELVHTHHKNHQRAFWAEVKSILPDYAQQKKWLDANGPLLRV